MRHLYGLLAGRLIVVVARSEGATGDESSSGRSGQVLQKPTPGGSGGCPSSRNSRNHAVRVGAHHVDVGAAIRIVVAERLRKEFDDLDLADLVKRSSGTPRDAVDSSAFSAQVAAR